MKGYTDIEQSKKLVELLPLETADMEYMFLKRDGSMVSIVPFIKDGYEESDCSYNFVPCWSLEALLQIMPQCIEDKYYLVLGTLNGNSGWYVCYEAYDLSLKHYIAKSVLIDACVEMIYKLKENNLL